MTVSVYPRSGFSRRLVLSILVALVVFALTLPYASYDYTTQQVVRWAVERGQLPPNTVAPCCNPLTGVFALSVLAIVAMVLFGFVRGRELRQKEKVQ